MVKLRCDTKVLFKWKIFDFFCQKKNYAGDRINLNIALKYTTFNKNIHLYMVPTCERRRSRITFLTNMFTRKQRKERQWIKNKVI